MAAEQVSSLASPGVSGRDLARRLGVAGFWGWWGGELAGLLPAGLHAAWQRRRTRPVIAFEADRATFWRPVARGGHVHMEPQGQVALGGETLAAARAAVAALGGGASRGTPSVTLCLPPRAVLRKSVTLPLAVEESLRQVIGYDLDRHTPFKPDELYYDAAVVARDPAHETLRVDLAAARRNAVDPLIRQVEEWGVRVAAVSPEVPARVASSPLDLLPADRLDARPWWRRWEFWLPAGAVLALALVAIALPIWQKRAEAIELNNAVDVARQQAAVSDTLRTEVDRQVQDYNFALERKFAFPSVVQILDDVTRLLPDDTWLTQFELRTTRGKDVTRELGLRGESANAGRLVSVLEDSKLFTQAAPRSPTTKIQPGPGEIFDVGAQLKPLPAPPAMSVVVAPGDVKAAPAAAQVPATHPAATAPGTAAPGASASSAMAPGASASSSTPQSASASSATPRSGTQPGAAPSSATPPSATPSSATPSSATPPAAANTPPSSPRDAAKGRT